MERRAGKTRCKAIITTSVSSLENDNYSQTRSSVPVANELMNSLTEK